eukprot:COSAG02_NODE_8838_length_2425_cov_34.954834_2_plen_177_part_00
MRAEWPACRAPPCTVCACLELNAYELTANAAALQLGGGGAFTARYGEVCQWDATQPEGRRCTVKPALLELAGLVFGSCVARNYQFPAPEGLGPPNSAADCEAIGPWCEYEMSEDGDRCDPDRDGFQAAIIVEAAAAPTEVLPPPGPPPAPTPGTSAADLAAISLAAGLAGLALALG